MKLRRNQGGFAYIAAVVLLVVVAGVIAATLRLTSAQQATTNDAVLIARAGQAARGGVEWMMYQIVKNAPTTPFPAALCTLTPAPPADPAPKVTNLTFAQGTGFTVTVKCGYVSYKEGVDDAGNAVTKNFYTIDSVGCNGGAGSCPDKNAAGAPDYTERRRVATICVLVGGGACY